MLQKLGVLSTWASLMRAYEQAYGPSVYESYDLELYTLFQEGAITNYYVSFTALANKVEGMTPLTLLSGFTSGLKKDIRRDVIPWRPEFITIVVTLAKLYEDKYVTDCKTVNKRETYNPNLNPLTIQIRKLLYQQIFQKQHLC